MEAYYNLNTGEISLSSNEIIKTIKLNGEDIENTTNEKTLKFVAEKPKSNLIEVNGKEIAIKFVKLKISYKKDVDARNLDGLTLIKLVNNPYVTKYKLTGKGMKVGIVDGGMVYKHYEFSNNNRVKYSQTTRTDSHSTHVCGTITAFGYNKRASGVTKETNIYSYTFNDHISSLTSCAKGGINATNNSYGFSLGWNYNNYFIGFTYEFYIANYKNETLEEPFFGKYSSYSADLDSISNKYPNFVMCFAAGNDREDKYTSGNWYIAKNNGTWVAMDPKIYPPPKRDGDYDCIDTLACAKNIITVGATIDNSSITTTFSSWGPTDDLRIKPEVVANGNIVFSTTNTGFKSYTSMSGTSMATPFATGSCILIQQFISNNLKYFPLSSTTKAALIQGTNNKIINGKNGFGLINMLNTLKFLEDVLLKKSILIEATIGQDYVYVYDNVQTLTVTLCWNDPVGKITGQTDINNPLQSITNKLSLYVENNGVFYYPFRIEKKELDAVQKTSTTFNQSLLVSHDNTQKIIIENLTGTSKVYVRNISSNINQKFSLCISPSF